ncbi:hypothetical protein EW146_g2936 [Bondarzewia mesenterica]|uniref:DUF6699 domain-containing protein n=1 Tax=Bondarzewia mesenterica TaxID=1095465 RepID=A0A4S4LZP6_9AGAM|nr:hypothetical protein EW146_g2936 [Bondarzewia mesenterica]
MASAVNVDKWAAGPAYGPVLPRTELYILKPELQLHPILTRQHPSFSLVFNLLVGQPAGFNADDAERDHPFLQANEPATLPRVQEIIIITDQSPWCTMVKNEQGVTLGDVFGSLWKEFECRGVRYTDNAVADHELAACPPRMQDVIKRAATSNQQASNPGWGFYSPSAQVRIRRVDWLREKTYFEIMLKDDNYSLNRLGLIAPDVFLMKLTAY